MLRGLVVISLITLVGILIIPKATPTFAAECKDENGFMKWADKGHDDNKPSEKKGKQLIESGAGICEIAKKCDHMEIEVSIKNEKELLKTDFYQNAPEEYQEELTEYSQQGSGHDSPNLVCYEIEDSIKKESSE